MVQNKQEKSTSSCSNCGGMEFTINEECIENSNSIMLKLCCDNCGNVIASCKDDSPSETDNLVTKLEKCLNLEVGGFKVVSMS